MIGGYNGAFGGSRSASVVNQGTISCDVSGGTIAVYAQPFSNEGLIQGTNGGTASLSGTLTPSASGTFNGAVQVANGTTIQGGTIVTLNGSALIMNSGVTLDGVTVNGNLDVGNSVNGANAAVTNGLVLNGTLLVGNPTNNYYGGVIFAGTQTLGGTGMVVFGDNSSYNSLVLAKDGTTLTIGPGITIRGQNGMIGGYNGAFGGSRSASVVNQGTISCDVSGGTITIQPQTFTSTGSFNGPVHVAGGTTILGGTIVTLNGSALIMNSGVDTGRRDGQWEPGCGQ